MSDEKTEMKVNKATEKIKGNPWILISIVLGIAVLILLFIVLKGGITGNAVKGDAAGQNLINFAEAQGRNLTINEISDEGSFYAISFTIDGKDSATYVTKDGKYLISPQAQLTGDAVDNTDVSAESVEVPKSDKPKVQAFIFSYCPFGLQFEKALVPVYNLLKNKADISIVAIGAMHGEFEKIESLRQISIEQIYGRDKLFAYLTEFNANTNIGSCNGDATCLNKYLPAIYTKLGIDKTKVENYMETSAEKIYDAQGAEASSLGISGSPTFVINGVQTSVSRNADAIKTAVCSAFNTAPSECSQTLSTASPSAGFGAVSGTAAASSASC